MSRNADFDVNLTPSQQMLSSCAGAFVVSVFMTPLDVVKIRLQAQDMAFERKCFLYSNGLMDHLYARVNGDPQPVAVHSREEICNCKWYNRPKYFNGTWDALFKISKVEGISSLWSGLSPTLVLAVPTTVIYFTTYEQVRRKLYMSQYLSRYEHHSFFIPLFAGGFSRAWAVTIVSPLEMIRTKMQAQKMAFSQIRDALRNTVKSEGIRGLWKGWAPTMMRDVPFSAIFWSSYEVLRSILMTNRHKFEATFIAGSVAGTIASTLTLPMDVIKTRRQIELGEAEIFKTKPGRVPSTLTIARDIFRAQGLPGLFSGLTPRILKVAPACAIMISSYEYCKRLFHNLNQQQDNQ